MQPSNGNTHAVCFYLVSHIRVEVVTVTLSSQLASAGGVMPLVGHGNVERLSEMWDARLSESPEQICALAVKHYRDVIKSGACANDVL